MDSSSVHAACAGHTRSETIVDLRPLRAAGAAMLAVAALLPSLPVPAVLLCPLRRLTGVPCPLCGATRAVTAAVHGDVGTSLLLNPAGIAAVALAVVLLVAWRWQRVTLPVWAPFAALAALWTYQLFKYTTGRPI